MHIQQFEKDISKVILSRGKNYYKGKSIRKFKQIAVNTWRASVMGSDEYFVYVELNNDHITESVCTCPFDGTCKHEVAVYYAIREDLTRLKDDNFSSFFEDKSRDQLIEILSQLLRENPFLIKQLTPQQPKTPDLLTTAAVDKRILQKLNPYLRMGYIGEYSVDTAFEGLYEVLEEIEAIRTQNLPLALELICQCIETTWQVDAYCDGWIYDQVTDSILQVFDLCIHEIDTKELAVQVTKFLLEKFKVYAKNKQDNVFLIEGATDLCQLAESKEMLLAFLDKFSKYEANPDLTEQLKFHIIEAVGSDEEIQSFYKRTNLSDSFRSAIISTAIDRGDYEEALSLCADGIENPKSPPSYKKQWLLEAFTVHGILNNPIAQRSIAFELAVDGHMEEYQKLKALYQQDEQTWQEVIDDLIFVLEEKALRPYHYPIILEAEQRWSKLLVYCEQQHQPILRFGQALAPHYPFEVETLHTLLLLEQAELAKSREQYRGLAVIISRMRDLGYNEKADEMKAYLIEKYPRKKALHEELN